jgi:hypothetical protein
VRLDFGGDDEFDSAHHQVFSDRAGVIGFGGEKGRSTGKNNFRICQSTSLDPCGSRMPPRISGLGIKTRFTRQRFCPRRLGTGAIQFRRRISGSMFAQQMESI